MPRRRGRRTARRRPGGQSGPLICGACGAAPDAGGPARAADPNERAAGAAGAACADATAEVPPRHAAHDDHVRADGAVRRGRGVPVGGGRDAGRGGGAKGRRKRCQLGGHQADHRHPPQPRQRAHAEGATGELHAEPPLRHPQALSLRASAFCTRHARHTRPYAHATAKGTHARKRAVVGEPWCYLTPSLGLIFLACLVKG
mmetsp:Transcript_65599/g.188760  ORF Transcript_65599/g.188760 Transcript_65599/m.188760 type:complete len:201 (+) Transcript_65599:2055-2657(+)